jgi:hypothetical protein
MSDDISKLKVTMISAACRDRLQQSLQFCKGIEKLLGLR